MRVVIVDPRPITGEVLRYVLAEAGHEVILVQSGAAVIRAVVDGGVDAVLLEAQLPDLDGWELCKELRGRRYTGPLIFVSEQGSTRAKVRAFEHGADDFIVEPYDPAELVARVGAVARRCQRADYQAMGTVLKVGDVELAIGELTVRVAGREPVLLTPTEMRLLECLMRNSQITISRETLIERTWGYDFVGESNRVDVYISRLRKKLERDPAAPEYLHTVRGVGYVFRPAPRRANVVALPSSVGVNGHVEDFIQSIG